MAPPILYTPGVYFIETDNSQYINTLTNTIPGIVGVASRGTVNENVLVTTLSELTRSFGVPTENYPALLAAREFLAAGGAYLWFVRVTDTTDVAASVTVADIDGSHNTVFTAIQTGSFFNNLRLAISYGAQLGESVSHSESLTAGVGGSFTQTLPNVPVSPGTLIVKFAGVTVAADDSNGNVAFAGDPSYPASIWSGTVNYKTGVVTITATSSLASNFSATVLINANYFSTFNVQVLERVYSSEDVLVATYVVETFTSLTPTNGVTQMAKSNYVNPDTFHSTFPDSGSFDLSGGTDGTSTINDSHYIGNTLGAATGLQILAFPDQISLNVALIPGASQSSAVRQALIELANVQRGDCMVMIDPPEDLTVQEVADWANANGSYSNYGVIDSNYGAIYYPWYNTHNNVSGDVDMTPPCAAGIQAFARSNYWEAPAGPNRGLLQNDAGVVTLLTPGDREYLGQNRINPLANLHGLGDMVLGQYTSTLESSSLDRIGARMTLLYMERVITRALYVLLFEPNTTFTWQRAVNLIQPFLNSQVNLGRIYAGQIFCDAITNIPDNVNNNIMVAVVVLELLKYAEIIVVNFQLEAYGVTISENIISPTTVGG
jgi:phage tail sheath protein FI